MSCAVWLEVVKGKEMDDKPSFKKSKKGIKMSRILQTMKGENLESFYSINNFSLSKKLD